MKFHKMRRLCVNGVTHWCATATEWSWCAPCSSSFCVSLPTRRQNTALTRRLPSRMELMFASVVILKWKRERGGMKNDQQMSSVWIGAAAEGLGGSAPLTLCILLIVSVQRSTARQQEKAWSHQQHLSWAFCVHRTLECFYLIFLSQRCEVEKKKSPALEFRSFCFAFSFVTAEQVVICFCMQHNGIDGGSVSFHQCALM